MPTTLIINPRPTYMEDLAIATSRGQTVVEDVGGSGSETLTKIDPSMMFNTSLPVFANNAAALAGGLVAPNVYRTSAGVLMITY